MAEIEPHREHLNRMIETPQNVRLLDLSFTDGARQLAISEAIMLAVGQGAAPPTIRLYSWNEPVVILGVGQPSADLDLDTCRERGYRVLRRIGGGTAVYHDAEEVSVDLIVPAGHHLGPTDVHAGYRQFAEILARALHELEVPTQTVTVEQARSADVDPVLRPICFASVSPYEFFHDDRKLDGLCQIRRRDAIAYQAAIYNRFPIEPLIASIQHASDAERTLRSQRLSDFVTDMATVSGGSVDYRALQDAIVRALTDHHHVKVEAGELTPLEIQETERLLTEKYANDEWTFRR